MWVETDWFLSKQPGRKGPELGQVVLRGTELSPSEQCAPVARKADDTLGWFSKCVASWLRELLQLIVALC